VKLSLVTLWNAALTGLALTTALSTGVVAGESDDAKTQTPIKHLVVIFFENHSFDNYFATRTRRTRKANPNLSPRRTPRRSMASPLDY